jgi:hypothetical protein
VNRGGSQEVVIEGETERADEVKAIYVGLSHGKRQLSVSANGSVGLPAKGKEQDLVKAVGGKGGETWKATIEKPSPKVAFGEQVLCVGVAMLKDRSKPPAFWHQTVTVDPADAKPR